MNVVVLSPGYPTEISLFVRALATVGCRVVGVGDQPVHALPEAARAALAHYQQVDLADAAAVLAAVRAVDREIGVERVECLWEPYLLLAAGLREALHLDGMTVEQTLPFRDKELMKQRLDAAGIRTPRHLSAATVRQVWAAAEQLGYPLVVKPLAGAGSADTYRVEGPAELAAALPLLRHLSQVSVEEFVDGEEFTFDTICADGEILFEHIAWYRPRPLQMRQHEWVSPVTISLRDLSVPHLQGGRQMGTAVIGALGFRTGFTHMEWYRKADGEVVFGEIGARPPGGRLTDLMNYATDADCYLRWAQAVTTGSVVPVDRPYNAAVIFKRARGEGRISRVAGLDELVHRYHGQVPLVDLLPIGSPRRDWRSTVTGDGMVVVRHPELQQVIEMSEAFARDFQLYAD